MCTLQHSKSHSVFRVSLLLITDDVIKFWKLQVEQQVQQVVLLHSFGYFMVSFVVNKCTDNGKLYAICFSQQTHFSDWANYKWASVCVAWWLVSALCVCLLLIMAGCQQWLFVVKHSSNSCVLFATTHSSCYKCYMGSNLTKNKNIYVATPWIWLNVWVAHIKQHILTCFPAAF